MPPSHIVVMGGSAGSVEILQRVVRALPIDLDAAVLVVVHLGPGARSRLPEILGRRASMPVHPAHDRMPLESSHVYVAPPDRHLTVEREHLRVVAGPRQNRHRPAIDPLFRSAARHYGDAVTALILSGAPGDGVAGAAAVAQRGGRVLVQDPAEALFAAMPERVLQAVPGAAAVPVEALPDRILRRVGARPMSEMPGAVVVRPDGSDMDEPSEPEPAGVARAAGEREPRASYGCPDCGGVLLDASGGSLRRFRCRVGHEYGADALRLAQLSSLEDALWAAVRGLEESADLADRLSRVVAGDGSAAARHGEHADDARKHADRIRRFLLRLLDHPLAETSTPAGPRWQAPERPRPD